MKPARGLLIVKPVETDDLQRGIILLSETRERMTQMQCEVVAVGEPAICETRKCEREHTRCVHNNYGGLDDLLYNVHPCYTNVGSWLLVRPRSFIEGPTPEHKEWFVHQDDVLAILNED